MKSFIRKSIIFIVVFISITTSKTIAQVDVQDSLALVDLYNSTNGPGWTNKTNWLTGPVKSWYGVAVNNGRVISINLHNNYLSGSIPIQIGNLSALLNLQLSQNKLVGGIPVAIGNLHFLQRLYLFENKLSGNIPLEIGDLTALQYLHLGNNQLTGEIPISIGKLTSLLGLYLMDNKLEGQIPSELGNLSKLGELYISNNELTGEIPTPLGNLKALQILSLNSNQLIGSIPISLYNLPNLRGLDLAVNKLSGQISSQISNLTKLQTLHLSSNQLSGLIPAEICNLSNLSQIYLYSNNLTGTVPLEISKLSKLVIFDIYSNLLTDLSPLPNSLSRSSLIQSNYFTFDDILPNITHLSTYSPQNTIGSPRTKTIYSGTTDTIQLNFDNGITTSTYTWYKNGTQVAQTNTNALTIANATSGNAGTYTCNITNANAPGLTLTTAPVTLVVKGGVVDQDSLALVDLYNSTNGPGWTNKTNWLTGPVKSWYGINTENGRIIGIDLIGNGLKGELPSSISALTSLQYLSLSDNQLSGMIPSNVNNLNMLESLDLSRNQLCGSIPELDSLKILNGLYLSSNRLNGKIPEELGELKELSYLELNNNQLSGPIPLGICHLIKLTNLNLSNNYLNGLVPKEIENLIALENLDLSFNQLSGSINDIHWADFLSLNQLSLNNNQLSGLMPLPSSLSYSAQIAFNQFTFKDILPNLTHFSYYSPQNKIGNPLSKIINEGTSDTIQLNFDNNVLTNTYNWYKNGNFVKQTKENYLVISNASDLDAGSYSCVVSNEQVAKLTLITAPIKLFVVNNMSDSLVLVELFNKTNGPNWINSSNWLTGPIKDWYGVTISNNRVTSLILNSNNLRGSLPENFIVLTKLINLDLSNNQIFNLSSLPDSLPKEAKVQLNQLTFEDIIPNIINISNYSPQNFLGTPRIKNVHAGATDTIQLNFDKNITTNKYTWYKDGTPIAQTNVNFLTLYNITSNDGGSYSCAISNLQAADLTLTTAPIIVNIGEELNLISDSLALVALYNTTNGEAWTYNYGWLKDPLKEWYGVSISNGRVNYIDLQNNNLNGEIPSQIGNLTELRYFNLSFNPIGGLIPHEIGKLKKLEYLELAGNQLSGAIPKEIGNLEKLYRTHLNGNQLSGSIPNEIGNLTSLQYLYLSDNKLNGSIPTEIGNLKALYELNLSNNLLSGSIPPEIGNLPELYCGFNISFNQVTGISQLPLSLLQSPNVQFNNLTFEDILPNIPQITYYNPQRNIGLSKTTYLNSNTSFSINLRIDSALTTNVYKWYKNGELYTTTNINTLTINNITTAHAGVYTCEVTNPGVSGLTLYSNPDTLVVTNIQFNTHPSDVSVCMGRSVEFSVHTNLAGMNYQWRRSVDNGTTWTDIQGAIDSVYTIASTSVENGYLYQCHAKVGITEITSNNARLVVNPLPSAAQPIIGAVSVCTGTFGYYRVPTILNADSYEWTVPSWAQIAKNNGDTIELAFASDIRTSGSISVRGVNACGSGTVSILPVSQYITPVAAGPILGPDASYKNATAVNYSVPAIDDAGSFEWTLPVGATCESGNGTNSINIRYSVSSANGNISVFAKSKYGCGDGPAATLPITIYPTILVRDSMALVDLYNSTNGPGWTNKTNWLTGRVSTWYGITVRNGKVSNINLANNNLVGSIPSTIGNINGLTGMYLHANKLTGEIPYSIGNLGSLINLYLYSNQLSGSIPSSIGNLANLAILTIHTNQLTGELPSSIGNLRKLSTLMLYTNNLTGSIPSSFGNLTALKVLYLNSNQLTGTIPSSLGNLTQLTTLVLNTNKLSGSIPSSLGNLSALTRLTLYGNQIDGSIPSSLGNLSNLTSLQLSSNQLTGEVPSSIGNLVNLTTFQLNSNQLSGELPPTLNNLSKLQNFNISNNKFTKLNLLNPSLTKITRVQANNLSFDDIIPNISFISTFSPQNKVGVAKTTRLNVCDTYTIRLGIDSSFTGNVYSWYRNGRSYKTTSVNTLEINNLKISDAGVYTCRITNPGLTTLTLTSFPDTLVVTGMQITVQPTPMTVCEGSPAGLSINTSIPGAYQWQASIDKGKTWTDITGAQGKTYALDTTALTDARVYRCAVSVGCLPVIYSDTARLTVNPLPVINSQPENQTLCEESAVSLSINATSPDNTPLNYQWQEYVPNDWQNISGQTGSSFEITAARALDKKYYRCQVTNLCQVNSNPIQFFIKTKPQITTQPIDADVCQGATASFRVVASGSDSTFQWYVSADGGSNWTAIEGASANIYALPATASINGYQYRCEVGGLCAPSVTSSAATLLIKSTPVLSGQPTNQSVEEGTSASFSVVASGDNLTYQWQRNSTGTWADINDATANIFAVPATSENIGNYRCIVSNTCISNIARLSIAPKPQIESHPKNQIACSGANVVFAVDVKGFELEYQWQYSADGVNSWTNIENATSENLEINATPSTVGYYKCIVAEAGGLSLETNAAQLTLRPALQISAHPTNLTICEGAPATFGCSLNVTEGLKYMWFESTDNGISWNPINGANAQEYAHTAALGDNNKQYRCNITDGCGIQLTTNAATLEVIPSTHIVTQPSAQALCEGSIAQFNVSATGAGLTYQWQQLGTTGWTNIAAQTPTYSVEVSADIHNKYYRCAVSGTCGTVNSQQALLSMGPQITNQLMNQMACDGSSVTLGDVAVLSSTPVNYEWEEKAAEETTWTKISGADKLRYTFNASMANNNKVYRAVAKGSCGMEACSNEARLSVVTTKIITSPIDISECHGNNIVISVQATGYELEYQWEESPDAGATWSEISGANAATLNISVLYSKNNYLYRCKVKCSCETNWKVSGAAKLTAYKNTITPLAATIKPVTCEVGTNDGAITIAAPTSDNMPVSFKWSNGATNLDLASLNAGNYTITVTDALGCRAIMANNVEYEAPIKVEKTIDDIAVPGTATGKIDATITGGHTPLALKWSNNEETEDLSDLKAGTYNLTITDSKQCVRQYAFVVKEQPAIAYLTGEDIPDAEHRELDKNLSVGSIAGSAGVSPTGAATYQIPIEVLPGVNNMQPQISVGYNSQSGNGLLGWGWNIGGLSAITRVPKTIYHDEYAQGVKIDANDAFALDGSRLMLIKAYGTDSSEYATENESFSKIKSYGSFGGYGPERFEVLAKNGARYVYGKADAKLIYEYVYLKDGRHALYDTIQAVLTWCLDTIVDKHGNYITYTYNQKGLNTYITKIDYGCNINTDCKVTNTIEFEYAERQDPISIHYGVKTSRMDMLLKSVFVKRANTTYRKYGFNYIKDDFSRLVKVTESTNDGKSINPTLFKWGKHSSDSISSKSIQVAKHPDVDPYSQNFISFDANNDGFTDLFGLYSDELGCTNARFNCNATYFGGPVSFTLGPWELLALNDYIKGANNDASWITHYGNSNYGDINGDGGIDIITPQWTHDAGSRVKFEIELASEFNSKKIGYRYNWDPVICVLTASSEAPVHTLGDINNDGYDEIVCIEKNSNEIINGSGDGRVRMKRFPGKIYYPKEKIWRDFNKFISPKKPERIAIVDVNNDGLKDVIVLNSMDWVIMENLGGNVLDFKVHGTNVDLDSEMISQMSDFSGDGLVDIIVNPRNGSTDWKLYINNGNFGFNEISNLGITAFDDKDTNKDDDKDNTIVFDFNNDGKKDIIVADAHYNWESNMWSSWKVFSYYTMYWYKSTGNGFVLVKTATSRNEKDAYSKFFAPGDFDGDGRVDLVNYGFNPYSGKSKKSQTWWMVNLPNKNNESDVIIGIADGLNKKTIINYKPLTDTSIYKTNRKYVYPFGVVVPPLYVVNEVKTNNGLGGYNIVKNKYENAVLHKQGKGFLGFDKLEQFNTTTGFLSITENTFNTSYFNLAKQLTATLHGTDTVSRAISYYTVRGNPANSKVIFTYPAYTQNVDKLKGITVNSSSEYDTNGNLTNQNSSVNEGFYKTKKEWTDFDGFGNPKTTTTTLERAGETPITRTQSYTYNNNGSVISSLVNGLTTTYGYDAWGNDTSVISAPGENQRRSSTLYSADGRFPAIQKNALGHLGKATFDDWGNPLTQTDANGNVTQNIYDSWGNLKEVKTPDKHVGQNIVEWVKEGDNQAPQYALYYIEKKVDDRFVSAEYFDALGRSLRKVTTGYKGAKFWTDIKYNNLGQVIEVSNSYPEGGSPSKFTISTYDYLGRVETQKSPEEVTIQNHYSGNAIKTTYSTGETYEKLSDVTGQIIEAKDPGGAIQYSYNSENKPRQLQSPGSTIQIKYDEYGRQDTLIDPNTGTVAYHYNLFGELVSQTDARGKTITSAFDKLGRIETKTADGVTTQYYYDKGEKALGTTDSIVRSDGTAISFKYTTDGLCRVKEETRRKDGISLKYGYDYNDKGLLSRLTYPGGFAVNYGYTEDDDLEEIRDARTEALLWKLGKINPKNGQVEETSYGDKLKVTYGYNANDQLNRIFVPGVIDFNYQYNEKQQLQWREELYFEKDAWAGFKEEFAYDPVNRLETASIGGVEKLRMKYADSNNTANDRITYKSDAGDYAYQSGNHQISVLTTVAGYTPPSHYLSYTAEGKVDTIREVTDTATVKRFIFGYGIDNQRFSMKYTVNDTLRYTRYYANNFEREIMADGTERNLTYIYANGTLVGINIQTAGTDSTFFVFTDQLGSLRCITDAEGKVRQRLSFDAWGNRRNPITGDKDTTILPSNGGVGGGLLLARGFTGHEHLDEMSLINMNGRVYDPVLGMFISPDNNLQAPDNTQNFNRYAYCLNNPLMYTDPSGEFIFTLLAAIFCPPLVPVAMNLDYAWTVGGYSSMENGGGFWRGAGNGLLAGAISAGMSFGSGLAINGLGITSTVGVAATSGISSFVGAGLSSLVTSGEWNWEQAITAGATSALISGLNQYEINHTITGEISMDNSGAGDGARPSTPTGVGSSDRLLLSKMPNAKKMMKKYNIKDVTVESKKSYNGGKVKILRDENGDLVVVDKRTGKTIITHPDGITVPLANGYDIYIGRSPANNGLIFDGVWKHEFNHAYMLTERIGDKIGEAKYMWRERVCYRLTLSQVKDPQWNELYFKSMLENGNAGGWNSFIDKHWKSYISPYFR